jgi:D-alanine-D-alanine ligase
MDRKLKVTLLYDGIEDRVKEEALARGEKFPALAYEEIAAALKERGHQVQRLAARSALELAAQIERDDSDLIFNLCEGFAGVAQREQHVASLLELFGKPFTGAGSIGLSLAQDKALAKKLLSFHGINTPRFSVIHSGEVDHVDDLTFPMFVKPSTADASIGIDHRSIVHNFKELMERISYIQTEFDAPALIEEFIDGREIYVSVLSGAKPEPLPIVEWDFSRVPEGTPKIASAEAKWDESSPRYKDAPEIIVQDLPEPVVKALQDAAVDAFRSLKLRDYGRIDMRLRRSEGRPSLLPTPEAAERQRLLDGWEFFLIEVNPNPHLATNSELPLAAKAHGLSYPDLIERIMENALGRTGSSRQGS